MRIIDAHSHYMPPEVAQHTAFFKVGWSDVNSQLAVMDKNDVEKALLLYPTSDAHLNMGGWARVCEVYNAGIAKVVKAHPQRFVGAGILPIDAPSQFLTELKRMQDLNLKVISLASSYNGIYLSDEKFFPIYDFARKYHLPVHVHPQIVNPIGEERVRDPLLSPVLEYVFDVSMCIGKMMMEGVFTKYPDVDFIFAHYGGVLPFVKERFDNTYVMLRKREFVKDLGKTPSQYFNNLYFDTSANRSAASLLCMLEVVNSSHIFFGSDYPANQDFSGSVSCIRNGLISDGYKKNILRNSFLEAL